MSARFSFHVDAPRNLVRITMAGHYTLEDVSAFLEARHEAHARLTCPANAHVTLNDFSEMKIQTQPVIDAFREMLAAPQYRSRRLAFIVGPTLFRNQLRRALGDRESCLFEDADEAEAWLFEEDRDTAPTRRAAG